MKTTQPAEPISEAKLNANRANAKLATGPKNTDRSRLNALKHGLSARLAWPGQDVLQDQEFFRRAWACISPRNPLEELYAANLLQTRLRENVFPDDFGGNRLSAIADTAGSVTGLCTKT
jgi:hypothetical protein